MPLPLSQATIESGIIKIFFIFLLSLRHPVPSGVLLDDTCMLPSCSLLAKVLHNSLSCMSLCLLFW